VDGTPQLAVGSPTEVTQDYIESEFSELLSSEISFDIPITINDRVEYFINYFQTEKRKPFCNWLSRSTRYMPRMREILRQNGLPEDLVYLAMIESGFNVNAYSRAHACGLWQFIKGTAGRYGLKVNYWLDERCDPEKATKAAAKYLKDLHQEFGCWYLAAAGYNAGENKIRKGITAYETADFWKMCDYDLFANETKDYVPQMIAAAIIAKNPEKYGFTDVEYQQPIPCTKVSVPPKTDLKAVGLACGVDYETIRELNAEFKRGCTPPCGYYKVSIPETTVQLFKDNFGRVKTIVRVCYQEYTYTIKKGDTLYSIARHFGTSVKSLCKQNNLSEDKKILAGRKIVVNVPVRDQYIQDIIKPKSSKKILAARSSTSKKAYGSGTKVKYHTVRKGDTIWNIARKYNVTPANIRSWNNIRGNTIFPGTRLKVPVSSTA